MSDAKTSTRASPSRPRSGKRRRVSAGDLAALRREMWHAVRRISALLDDESATPELLTRVANSLAALGNAYTKLTETTELEAEVREIKAHIEQLNADGTRRWAA